jgi:hypothetical protein
VACASAEQNACSLSGATPNPGVWIELAAPCFFRDKLKLVPVAAQDYRQSQIVQAGAIQPLR